MSVHRRNKVPVPSIRLFCVCIPLSWVLCAVGSAAPPLETFPIPHYSFDLASSNGAIGADSILVNDPASPSAPVTGYDGSNLELGRPGDDLDALSAAHAYVLPGDGFVLLFSVDRQSTGDVPPDADLVAQAVPYNATDQVARGHAAGDMYLSMVGFNTNGRSDSVGRQSLDNNTLGLNNYDEGGRDFRAQPYTSAQTQGSRAYQDNVDATAVLPTNGPPPHVYYSVAVGSSSLSLGLPGDSAADIFFDGNPTTLGGEAVYATAEDLGLVPEDDIDALIVFDFDTNGVFDSGDQVLFTLARGSPSLATLPEPHSPATIYLVGPGPPTVFATPTDLGLSPTEDNIDTLELLFCDDGRICAEVYGIRFAFGDFDADNDVDMDDYEGAPGFASCFTGAGGTVELGCEPGDLDEDGDVDCLDWQEWVLLWTDPGEPPEFSPCSGGIPAVPTWGLVLLALLILGTAAGVFARRSTCSREPPSKGKTVYASCRTP